MRSDLNDIIEKQPSQHSLDWYRARLGRITGSQVGRLMQSGKGDALFGKDAMAYINEIASERLLNPADIAVDDKLDEYLLLTTTTNKAMAWGIDQEMNARGLYCSTYKHKVKSCGAIQYADWCWWFASSPDGVVIEENGVIEIKCPMPKTHTEYLFNVTDAESLKALKPLYYWQCLAHMLVTDAHWCDWMTYCPFSQKPLHVVRIEYNTADAQQLLERVGVANSLINAIVNKCKKTNRQAADDCVINK